MNEANIAWAAGLFEGEGSIFLVKIRNYSYPRLNLKMTDEDIVRKFASVVSSGKVYFTPKQKSSYKDSWYWQECNIVECKRIIQLFWPYLGTRRKNKAIELNICPDGEMADAAVLKTAPITRV